MTPLDRGQLQVLRVRAALQALGVFVAVLVAALSVLRQFAPPAAVVVGAALLLPIWVLLMTGRRYRAWGYRMDEDELHIGHGLWIRTRTIVPFGRVQHIDVAQGPLERRFGVATLILHTAGTRSSAVILPGLHQEEASRMRDLIRAKIRQDLM